MKRIKILYSGKKLKNLGIKRLPRKLKKYYKVYPLNDFLHKFAIANGYKLDITVAISRNLKPIFRGNY